MNSIESSGQILSDNKDNKDKMSKTEKQLLFSAIGAILFLILSNKMLYKLTNFIFSPLGMATMDENGCPTMFGLIVHTIVYFLLIFAIMKISEKLRK